MKKALCLLLAILLLPLSVRAGNWATGCLQSQDGYVTLYEDKGRTPIAALYNGVTVEYDHWGQRNEKAYLFVYVKGYNTLSGYVPLNCVQDLDEAAPLEKAVLTGDAGLYATREKEADQIGFLPKDFQVWLLGEAGDCYYVRVVNSLSTGFMDKQFLRKTGETGDPSQAASPVAAAQVYTLKEPGQELAPTFETCEKRRVTGMLKKGTQVNIYQYNDQWALVSTSHSFSARASFIERRFLEETWDHTLPEKYVMTTSPSNRLLLRPSVDSEEYTCKLYPGTPVTLFSQQDAWCFVRVGDVTGYVKQEFLSDTPVQSILTATLYKPYLAEGLKDTGTYDMLACQEEKVLLRIPGRGDVWVPLDFVTAGKDQTIPATVTSGSLKMRAAPNSESSVILTVSKGKKVDVLILGDVWSLVQYKGETGYMMTRYLQH